MFVKRKIIPAIVILILSLNVAAWSQAALGNATGVKVTNTASINTEHLEFSPSYYQNGLVYTTAQRQRGRRDGNIDETFFELSFAELDGNGMPIEGEQFSIEMNSQVHEGPVTFSRDGRTIFFTRNNMVKGVTKADSNGKIRMKVFKATKGAFDWEEVRELPFNNDEYDVMHPTLSADGKILYFTSNMPGSMGGTDIWMVSKDGDNYGTPVNLGPNVNSDKNDAFPFIHESGTLFYASEGKGGLGGYDLFQTTKTGESWGAASNLGAPLNSTKDDFGLIMNAAGRSGYFTSSRNDGSGKDDIYKFEVGEDFVGGPAASLAGTLRVFDKATGARIEGAEVRAFERGVDGLLAGGELYDVVLLGNASGSNELTLKLVPKDGALVGDPNFLTDTQGEHPYTMSVDKQYIFFVSKEGYNTKEMVYTTAGRQGDVIVEIPLEKKTCTTISGTVVDTKTGGLLPNTTIRLSGNCVQSNNLITSDANGRFETCLPVGCEYTLSGSRTGYTDGMNKVNIPNFSDVTTVIQLTPFTPTPPNISTPSSGPSYPGGTVLGAGSTIVLDKIYYDFNKSSIRKGAARELEGLSSIMKSYPSMEIELMSHTDSRGTTEYNMNLSRRRAESAKRYLVSRGVEARRIVALGMGESQPRNGCSDGVACNEEEHQYNRRTEVRVVRINESVEVRYGDSGPEVIDRRN